MNEIDLMKRALHQLNILIHAPLCPTFSLIFQAHRERDILYILYLRKLNKEEGEGEGDKEREREKEKKRKNTLQLENCNT